MAQAPAHRRLAAILAADVVGYSRLMEADETGTLARLRTYRLELIDPAIARHRGRLIKTAGDGMLVEFSSVADAVACAVEIQRGMARAAGAAAPEDAIRFRIGINLGDVIVDTVITSTALSLAGPAAAVTVMVLVVSASTPIGMRAVTVTGRVSPRGTFRAVVGVISTLQPGAAAVALRVKLSLPLPVLVRVWVKVNVSSSFSSAEKSPFLPVSPGEQAATRPRSRGAPERASSARSERISRPARPRCVRSP